jgi:hypothetical protein
MNIQKTLLLLLTFKEIFIPIFESNNPYLHKPFINQLKCETKFTALNERFCDIFSLFPSFVGLLSPNPMELNCYAP